MTANYNGSNYYPALYWPENFEYWPELAIVFTGLIGVDVHGRFGALDVQRTMDADALRRIEALDAPIRAGAYIPSLITLPDGSGYWLFGDGSRIMWGAGDTGEQGKVKRRLGNLQVKRG